MSDGQVYTAFVHAYKQSAYILHYDFVDRTPPEGTYLIEGYRHFNHISTLATLSHLDRSTGRLDPSREPVFKPTDFDGAFLRYPAPAEAQVGKSKADCTVVAVSEEMFVVECPRQLPLDIEFKLTLIENGRKLEYNVVNCATIAHGRAFRHIGRLEINPRVLLMFWHRLTKAA